MRQRLPSGFPPPVPQHFPPDIALREELLGNELARRPNPGPTSGGSYLRQPGLKLGRPRTESTTVAVATTQQPAAKALARGYQRGKALIYELR